MAFGEITTTANINYAGVIRNCIEEIGYDDISKGLDYKSMEINLEIEA